MSTDNDIERELALADRYPASTLADLDLDLARDELRREITGTPRRRSAPATVHRRSPWLPAVAAAAAVTVVVTAGLALRDGDRPAGGPGGTEAVPAAPAPASTPPTRAPAPDSLSPTSGNLQQVVLDVPGWSLTSVDEDPAYGGSMVWEHGAESLEVTWSPARDHDTYARDRAEVGPARAVTALGQDGKGYSYGRFDQPPSSGGPVVADPTADPEADDPSVPDLTRWQVLFPPVGDWFLEVDVSLREESGIRPLLHSLTRVDRRAWRAHLDAAAAPR
jgi:hypothetical protein